MVVADDAAGFYARSDQEIDQHRLELRLSGLEIVAGDEDAVELSVFDETRDEGVLRRAVDVSALNQRWRCNFEFAEQFCRSGRKWGGIGNGLACVFLSFC